MKFEINKKSIQGNYTDLYLMYELYADGKCYVEGQFISIEDFLDNVTNNVDYISKNVNLLLKRYEENRWCDCKTDEDLLKEIKHLKSIVSSLENHIENLIKSNDLYIKDISRLAVEINSYKELVGAKNEN